MDLINRKYAVSRISDLLMLELKGQRIPTWNEVYNAIGDIPSVPAVPIEIDETSTAGGWISVKDRMPETRHAVLVYTPHHKNIWAATMHEDGNWYIWTPGGRAFLDPDWYGPITHWMPLPEPPKEDKP